MDTSQELLTAGTQMNKRRQRARGASAAKRKAKGKIAAGESSTLPAIPRSCMVVDSSHSASGTRPTWRLPISPWKRKTWRRRRTETEENSKNLTDSLWGGSRKKHLNNVNSLFETVWGLGFGVWGLGLGVW